MNELASEWMDSCKVSRMSVWANEDEWIVWWLRFNKTKFGEWMMKDKKERINEWIYKWTTHFEELLAHKLWIHLITYYIYSIFTTPLSGDAIWEGRGIFGERDIHHQVAIVLKSPPFREEDIKEPIKTSITLRKKKDG